MEVKETELPHGTNEARYALSQGAQKATEGADVVADKVAGVAARVAASLDAKGDQLTAIEKKLAGSARGYLRHHPLASLGVAVAAGYVLSRLLTSR